MEAHGHKHSKKVNRQGKGNKKEKQNRQNNREKSKTKHSDGVN